MCRKTAMLVLTNPVIQKIHGKSIVARFGCFEQKMAALAAMAKNGTMPFKIYRKNKTVK